MKGKVVVITGATSGIGLVAAGQLAARGARIVLVARDRGRGEATLAGLRQKGPGVAHAVHYADLSRIAEMKRVAAAIAEAEPRIDVLVNNAGALFATRQVTEDGLEMTFATNHMSYFVVTHGLMERLAPDARIVNTASEAHRMGRLDFDDLQFERGWGANAAYSRSKLCNILYTRELARRLKGTGITANALHPGFVNTRFGDQNGGWFSFAVKLAKLFATTPEKGAETIVHLAASPEVAGVTGEYFAKRRPAPTTAAARDEAAAQRLWAISERLAGFAS
jgi:NAD(P)-dependent dehydrogenase (short-subunit alcohol dehydrogenase family)